MALSPQPPARVVEDVRAVLVGEVDHPLHARQEELADVRDALFFLPHADGVERLLVLVECLVEPAEREQLLAAVVVALRGAHRRRDAATGTRAAAGR